MRDFPSAAAIRNNDFECLHAERMMCAISNDVNPSIVVMHLRVDSISKLKVIEVRMLQSMEAFASRNCTQR